MFICETNWLLHGTRWNNGLINIEQNENSKPLIGFTWNYNLIDKNPWDLVLPWSLPLVPFPFQIIDKIRQVTHKLALPAYSAIHPVFHVLLLKKAAFLPTSAIPTLPNLREGRFKALLEKVVNTRTSYQGDKVVPQLLIKWQHYPSLDSTWEDASFIAE